MAETAPLSIEEARTTPPQPSDAPLASAGGLDNDSARSLDVSAVPSNDEDQARYGEI